jgi:DNA modification methylase
MTWRIEQGDWIEVLRTMPDESVHCVVTSPPYWGLRDYGVAGQLGLERTPDEYVAKMVEGFREVRRVLRDDGSLWLNLGDSYASAWACKRRSIIGLGSPDDTVERGRMAEGLKEKDLCGIPWMVALALRSDGWYLRQDIIWAKPNPMPESVRDRCTKAHEYIFLLSKGERYFYDAGAISEDSVTNDIRRPYGSQGAWELDGRPEEQKHGGEPRSFRGSQFNTGKTAEHQLGRASDKPRVDTFLGEKRNKRSVWSVSTSPFPEAHFATFPPEIPETCIKAGCPENGTVLDPFNGAGTTGLVATRLGRNYIGIELKPNYIEMATRRIEQDAPLFNIAEKSTDLQEGHNP